MELSTKVAVSIMFSVLSASAGMIGAVTWNESNKIALDTNTPYVEKSVINVNHLLKDKKPPIIEVENQRTAQNSVFDPYAHVQVNDAQDGDISNQVEVYGSVDTTIKGVYEIRYVVRNSFGLKAEKKIRVIVD